MKEHYQIKYPDANIEIAEFDYGLYDWDTWMNLMTPEMKGDSKFMDDYKFILTSRSNYYFGNFGDDLKSKILEFSYTMHKE